jgi:hypothetical protein
VLARCGNRLLRAAGRDGRRRLRAGGVARSDRSWSCRRRGGRLRGRRRPPHRCGRCRSDPGGCVREPPGRVPRHEAVGAPVRSGRPVRAPVNRPPGKNPSPRRPARRRRPRSSRRRESTAPAAAWDVAPEREVDPHRLVADVGGGANMHGQPPPITVMPCARPYSVAVSETVPAPKDRCIHTCLIPRSAHPRMSLQRSRAWSRSRPRQRRQGSSAGRDRSDRPAPRKRGG